MYHQNHCGIHKTSTFAILVKAERKSSIETLIRAAADNNKQRPLFILTYVDIVCSYVYHSVSVRRYYHSVSVYRYGVANYVDVALEMTDRLEASNFSMIGAQDLAKLGYAARQPTTAHV